MASMTLGAVWGIKFVGSAWSVVFSSCSPSKHFSFATHPPALEAVDQSPICSNPCCVPIASSVPDSSHNLILCDEVMSVQWGYGTSLLRNQQARLSPEIKVILARKSGNLIFSSLPYCMLSRINQVRVFEWYSWTSQYNHKQASFRTLVAWKYVAMAAEISQKSIFFKTSTGEHKEMTKTNLDKGGRRFER